MQEPARDDVAQKPVYLEEYVRILEEHSPVQKVAMGPAYMCPAMASGRPSWAVAVTSENLEVLRSGLEDWIPDVHHSRPFMAVLLEGRAVSVCGGVRITLETHEAGVETINAYRDAVTPRKW